MKYIFGPVVSRRLNLSLGIDLVPLKVCSMDCLYCEVGETTLKTLERGEYVPLEKVKLELESFLSQKPPLDFITFSGYGEPTLFSGLGELVQFLKGNYDIPLALLTNSTLLFRDDVIEDIMKVDVILPSLDTVRQQTLEKLNRPAKGVTVKTILQGLEKLKNNFHGEIWIETLFVKGINDSEEEIKALGKAIHELNPDKWQINTVARPPAYNVKGLSYRELEKIADKVGFERTEVVAKSSSKRRKIPIKDLEDEVYALVLRRPCPEEEISSALGIPDYELRKIIEILKSKNKVEVVTFGDVKYIKGLAG